MTPLEFTGCYIFAMILVIIVCAGLDWIYERLT